VKEESKQGRKKTQGRYEEEEERQSRRNEIETEGGGIRNRKK
jgi:hypothetical protein